MTRDEYWMRKALALARRGEGLTRPNPPVGAILVRGKSAVGSGFHRRAGQPHAEIAALRSAGTKSKGATLYVSLEPCSTRGKTGPCTDAIIEKGVSRVVVSARDPNPSHSGRGLALLRKAGVDVCEGVCVEEGRKLIAPFSKWITTGKPYLTLKMGMSLDGRIADSRGRSKWITCGKSRKFVQQLRQRVDAILVGRQTVCIDNPSLLCKGRARNSPFRVIVDSSGSLPLRAKVVSDDHTRKTIIATTQRCSGLRRRRFALSGALVWVMPMSNGLVSLPKLLSRLGKMDIIHILCEGGGELAHGLIRARLVDEYLFFIAPRFIGGHESVPVVSGKGWTLDSAPRLMITDCERVGDDVLLRAVQD